MGMALVRILVDGYSLLHDWPEMAPGAARHSEAAREALIQCLNHYQDLCGTPITIFFDGQGSRRTMLPGTPKPKSQVEVIYSTDGKTADDLIERTAHLYQPYGEVLIVTNDVAERETVYSVGGMAANCRNFIIMVENAMAELQDDLKHYNRKEQHRFTRKRE